MRTSLNEKIMDSLVKERIINIDADDWDCVFTKMIIDVLNNSVFHQGILLIYYV